MPNAKRPAGPTSPRKLMEIKVGEVMNKRPQVVHEDTSIEGLIERMVGQIQECFPVVDKDFRLLGIVTESDLFQVLYPQLPSETVGSTKIREVLKYSAKTVGDIMTRRPITATPGMSLREAMGLMAAHKLRRLPVVEGERLVGLLSLRDIIELYRIIR
ncbi:MAG: CBS domain-containing protein [Candidatus Hadarchaeum sp.]|uniref:CBS domain-containing protein n=1 Tax=Candidatus Hadarchaeum sp. TaxID=2883567 RepID=UPI003D0FA46E